MKTLHTRQGRNCPDGYCTLSASHPARAAQRRSSRGTRSGGGGGGDGGESHVAGVGAALLLTRIRTPVNPSSSSEHPSGSPPREAAPGAAPKNRADSEIRASPCWEDRVSQVVCVQYERFWERERGPGAHARN